MLIHQRQKRNLNGDVDAESVFAFWSFDSGGVQYVYSQNVEKNVVTLEMSNSKRRRA